MVFRLIGLVLNAAITSSKLRHVTEHLMGVGKIVLLKPDQVAIAIRDFPFLVSYIHNESELRELVARVPLNEEEYKKSLREWEPNFREWFEYAKAVALDLDEAERNW